MVNDTAQLVFCNVPARDTSSMGSLVQFYATLLGVDAGAFVQNTNAPIEQYETPVSGTGIDLLVSQRNDTREVTTTYWSVPDINAAIETLKGKGGQVVSGPTEMPDGGGTTAVLLDPEGNYVAVVQLTEDAHQYFRIGKFGAEDDERLARRRKQLRSAVAGRAD